MAETKKTAASKDPEKAAEKTNKAVQEKQDVADEQGFYGNEVDTTPNENYTLEGVTSGKPTPESSSDPALARRQAASDLAAREEQFNKESGSK